LLLIFLFNLGGYLLLFQYFIYRSDNLINQRINHNNYNKTELVQVKIPVHMPAVVNWDDYEQISGEMAMNGYSYNYVGLKVTQDTMYLLCLPNDEKTRLIAADNTYAKQVSDSPQSKKSNSTLPKVSIAVSKYDHHVTEFHFEAPVSVAEVTDCHYQLSLDQPSLSVNGEPPEYIA
jgi:hypothetical protein